MKYTTEEVLKITGSEPNVLRAWLNARRIVPDIANEVGRGRQRLFSYRNLFEVTLALEFHNFGVSGAQIGEVLNFFRSLDEPDVAQPKVAEIWARLRSWERPTNALVLYRPDRPKPFFEFLLGGNSGLPPGSFDGGHACLVVDVMSILTHLRAKTDCWWPPEFRREPNPEVWARIEAERKEFRKSLERSPSPVEPDEGEEPDSRT